MQHKQCLHFRADIFEIAPNGHHYAGVASHKTNIKIVDIHSCNIIRNIYVYLLGEETTAIAFHPNLDIMAIANTTTLYLLNTTHREIMQTIQTHDGTISMLSFHESLPYLITGTSNGRVMQYRYEGKRHISRLCSFPYTESQSRKKITYNYVSALASNDKYIACSGYGSALIIVALHSHARKISFKVSQSKISAITFLKNNRILFANTEGTVFLASIRKNALVREIQSGQREIKQLIALEQKNYILLVSPTNSIALLDIDKKKIVASNFITFEKDVRKVLSYENNTLLVLLIDNTLHKINFANRSSVDKALNEGALLDAMQLLEANPMLQNTPEARQAAQLYKKLYNNVMQRFIKTNNKEILYEMEPYSQLQDHYESYQNLLLGADNYAKLKIFYNEHKYALAYTLCEKFPALQMTPEYRKMEEQYRESFTLAQKQLLRKRKEQARAILAPFATVSSKRAMIHLLLRQNKEFMTFIKAVAQKEYETVEKLLCKNTNFQEIPSYTALQKEIQEQLETIQHNINNAKIPEAIAGIKKLQNVPGIIAELDELYALTQAAQTLLHYYKKENFVLCYESLDQNSRLESMQLAQLLEKHWSKLVEGCEIYALEGNILAIKEKLGELLYISTRKSKIGDLLRLSFQAKIDKKIQRKQIKSAENLIYSYIDIFGMDNEMKQIMQHFERNTQHALAITFNQQKHKDRNEWNYADIM